MGDLKISRRLEAIAGAIPVGTGCLFDIGSDHGLLAAYAVLNGLAGRAVASDISPGPVVNIGKTVKKYGIEAAVEIRMADGLDGMTVTHSDTVVIAGMGGLIMTGIADRAAAALKASGRLILQPMTEDHRVRQWLHENCFEITAEAAVKDGHRVYVVISAVWTGVSKACDEAAFHTGVLLLSDRSEAAAAYFEKKIRHFKRELKGLTCRTNTDETRRLEVLDILARLNAICGGRET